MLKHYEQAVKNDEIENNEMQLKILPYFEDLISHFQMNAMMQMIVGTKNLKGIYLYGSVGAGKTFLMDLFFNTLPVEKKQRAHFHDFMQLIHQKLKEFQGQANPLKKIAQQLAKSTKLLCLDEFMVDDIATAMIMGEFLKAIFSQGIVLVTTSNIPPDLLYLHGLQRNRFLPAIDLLKSHCNIISLNPNKDYRFAHNATLKTYIYPLNQEAEILMDHQYKRWTSIIYPAESIQVLCREIPIVACSERAIWFDFNIICMPPRCTLDYLEIVKCYDMIFISNIDLNTDNQYVKMLLLVQLIDILYDHHIRLIITAADPISELFPKTQDAQKAGFLRAQSRLHEMQTELYWRG